MVRTGLAFAAGLMTASVFAAASAPAGGSTCTPHSVKVSGQGSANTVPQVYTFHVDVTRRGTDLKSIAAEVGKLAAASVHAARSVGVAQNDIQSTAITVNPVYNPKAKPGAPRVYEVRREIALTLRHPSRYGALIEGLMRAGVNGISRVTAQAADPGALTDRALAAALADARHKAALIAKGLGVEVGAPLAIDESGGGGPRPVIMGAMRANSGHGGYEPGKITVNATVTARFALVPSGCSAK